MLYCFYFSWRLWGVNTPHITERWAGPRLHPSPNTCHPHANTPRRCTYHHNHVFVRQMPQSERTLLFPASRQVWKANRNAPKKNVGAEAIVSTNCHVSGTRANWRFWKNLSTWSLSFLFFFFSTTITQLSCNSYTMVFIMFADDVVIKLH